MREAHINFYISYCSNIWNFWGLFILSKESDGVHRNHISLKSKSTRWMVGLGRISGHFQYLAGCRILKLSGYRISGWFLTPDIRLSGNFPDIERWPDIRPEQDIQHNKSAGYPVSGQKSIRPNPSEWSLLKTSSGLLSLGGVVGCNTI